MSTKLNHPIWDYIPQKSNNSFYFPSGRCVSTKSDCNGIIQTNLYNDVIIGKSIFGYNQPIEKFYNNRGKRFAHSSRESSFYNLCIDRKFDTSYQSEFVNNSVNKSSNNNQAVSRNYKHQPFITYGNLDTQPFQTSYSTEYLNKNGILTNYSRNSNKNRMISSASLQYHMKDPRFCFARSSTTYRETTDKLGEERIFSYRASLEPVIPSEIVPKNQVNFRKVSGNVILSKIRRTNQLLIS